MASMADIHALYELSVQNTEAEYEFVDKTFKKLRNRRAYTIREDFCGTANMSCEWVKQRKKNTAIGVDLDESVLEWGRKHHIDQLKPEQAMRVSLVHDDVLKVRVPAVDSVLAMNFSYQLFKDRKTLGDYFRRVHEALADDGVFFLDAFGGYDAFREMKEKTKHKKFTYIWDQAKYDPNSGHMTCYIHFKFPDNSKLSKAFIYEWRLWTLPEIQELLQEAGFKDVIIYWQGNDDETGEGDGIFKPRKTGRADAGWVCYVAALK